MIAGTDRLKNEKWGRHEKAWELASSVVTFQPRSDG